MIDKSVAPIDKAMVKAAQQRNQQLAKPYRSLGKLETLSAQIAGIRRELFPLIKGGAAVVVFSADNGVALQGVTPLGQEVTMQQTTNMAEGRAGISVLCKNADAKLFIVDVGMAQDSCAARVLRKKIRSGTSDISQGPAMTRNECEQAMDVGAQMADLCVSQDMVLLGGGEMGIGNTTTSSAILSVLLDKDVEAVTGHGAGLSEEAYLHKMNMIRQAITINQPDKNDPIDVLHKLGGFDIAALTGYYIRAAQLRRVVVVDGFITIVAALLAYRIAPNIRDYFVLSHRSMEPGYDLAAKEIGISPVLDLQMRLGEGTGCPLVFNLLEASVRVLRDMATFEEISIDNAGLVDCWEQRSGLHDDNIDE